MNTVRQESHLTWYEVWGPITLPEGFDFESKRSVKADGAVVSLCLNPDKLQFVTNELDYSPSYASLLPFVMNGDVGDDPAVPVG